jgi:hypothetical protein
MNLLYISAVCLFLVAMGIKGNERVKSSRDAQLPYTTITNGQIHLPWKSDPESRKTCWPSLHEAGPWW